MSNIQLDEGVPCVFYYEEVLQKKILNVCKKIGFDDSKVTWIIYNPDRKRFSGNIGNIVLGVKENQYGYCEPSENKIWISTLSIEKSKGIQSIEFNLTYKEDFLANVILDEITHIQTKCNHKSKKYDSKFEENKRKYYLSPLDRMLSGE